MPRDQSGSLLSLRLVRIPRLRNENDVQHFLSSRQGPPIQKADSPALGRLIHNPRSNGFGIALYS
jgi:hypothetical protein